MNDADFLAPEGLSLLAAGETLRSVLPVRDGGSRESDRTFYDTFDGLAHAVAVSVIHERGSPAAGGGRLALVDRTTGEEHAWIYAPQPTQPLLAIGLHPGPFRDALVAIVDVRALLALVRVHSRLRTLNVLDAERKIVVRMILEEPSLVSSSGWRSALRPRLRVALVRGYEDELARVRRLLADELGFRPAAEPLVDEAVRAAGGRPGGTTSKVDVRLSFDQRADSAAGAVLRALLAVIESNLPGTIADVDAEYLHDFRVAVRRSRAVQRELKGAFPPAELASFRSEFRWLQQVTGDARDLDVYVLEFDSMRALVSASTRPDLEPLLAVLQGRRLTARREMVRALRSERASRLLADWEAFLVALVGLGLDDRADAVRPIGALAGERIRKVYRRMLKLGGAIDASSPPEAYHELRKKGKELRYLLELFGAPLYPGDVVKPMVKALKSLQDVLGRHQDREVQVATLRSLRDEVSALPGGAAALMAMGVLVERLAEDERAARGEFASRYAEFASKRQRDLVNETFG